MSDPFTPGTPPRRPEPGGESRADIRQAGEDLRNTARETREAAGEAASTVSREAAAAAETVKREGAALLGTARDRAEGMAQEGVRTGAEQAQGIARAIHRAADELEGQSPTLARTIHDTAEAVDGMARSLRERSPGEMLRGAEDFARRQPLAFFGAAALAGFALARFARASATHHHPDGGRHDTMHDMTTAGTGANGAVAGGPVAGGPVTGGAPGYPHGPATPHESATGAPGWSTDDSGTPRPSTLASASLGGAASYRPRGQDQG